MKHSVFCLVLILMTGLKVLAQDGGTVSNLSSGGIGSRALGVGNAFTALADDPSAVFWNPAGLEYVSQQSLMLFHMTVFEGTLYDFIGYSYPTLSLGSFGAGIGRIGTGGVDQRDIYNNPQGTAAYEEYQFFLSYAKRLPWDVTLGTTIKAVRRGWSNIYSEGNLSDVGVGLDLGLMYRPEYFSSVLLRDWSVGLNLQNIVPPKLNEGLASDDLPLSVKAGLMRRIPLPGSVLNLLMDTDITRNRDLRLHFGAEYRYGTLGNLRLGFDPSGLTYGAGTQYSIFQVDYGFGNSFSSAVFSPMHRITVSVNFGRNREEMFRLAETRRQAEEERIIAEVRELDKQRSIATHLKQAGTFFTDQKYMDAIVEYQQVLSEDPFHPEAKMMLDSSNALLAKDFQNQQNLAVQAAIDKERAEQDQLFIARHYERGRILIDQKQFTEALIEFNLGLERDPQNSQLTEAIATTRRRLNEEIGSLLAKIRTEFTNQNYSEALRLVADARLLGGDNPQVLQQLETLAERIKIQDNIQRGLLLYEIGQYDDALQVFEQAMQLDPENPLLRQYYDETRMETSAASDVMDPETERRYLEGVDLFLSGKYQPAIDLWEEVLKKHPYNKKILAAIKGARERLKNSRK